MSHILISRSPDLQRLKDDGYELEIRANHLVVNNIPYANATREVKRGKLACALSLAGEQTTRPETHVVMFAGDCPCDYRGKPLDKIINSSGHKNLGEGLEIDHTFSSKPKVGYYTDYYEKVTTYESILSGHAEVIDPSVTARTFRIVESNNHESPFAYHDTASSNVGIWAVTQKLASLDVAIVGLGGTGSYTLDFLAKTPVRSIHIYDQDHFLQHNAFRAPGAPTLEALRGIPLKVEYLNGIYSSMHRGIVVHDAEIDSRNVNELCKLDFVFLCLDNGKAKAIIIRALERAGKPFIDVGLGIDLADEKLIGALRVTTSTKISRPHFKENNRIPLEDIAAHDIYATNIQVAELNALGAALAVIKWKKLNGFYADLENEHSSVYSIDGNHLLNEDLL